MARPHHYQFAHQDLPAHFFNNSAHFLKLLDEDGKLFLHYLWSKTAERCEQNQRLDYELTYEKKRHKKFNLFILGLPEAIEVTEVHFILMASDGRKHFYYTLEFGKGLSEEAADLSIHCAWTAKGTHENFGELKNPNLEGFVSACTQLIDKK